MTIKKRDTCVSPLPLMVPLPLPLVISLPLVRVVDRWAMTCMRLTTVSSGLLTIVAHSLISLNNLFNILRFVYGGAHLRPETTPEIYLMNIILVEH